jgi:hypothetical protein
MTPLIAVFSVLVLLGCLHMQIARDANHTQPRCCTKPAAAQL